jgi:hypothetical protein
VLLAASIYIFPSTLPQLLFLQQPNKAFTIIKVCHILPNIASSSLTTLQLQNMSVNRQTREEAKSARMQANSE